MGQSPSWEANRFRIPEGLLRHSQVPVTCPYPEPARSISYPHNPTSWRSILILSSHLRLGLPSCLFPSCFPTKTLYTPLLSPMHTTCPAYIIRLVLNTRTILGEQYRSLSSSLCSFLHLVPFRPKYSPQRPILKHLCSSVCVSDQVSHPYKTTGRFIVVQCPLLFM